MKALLLSASCVLLLTVQPASAQFPIAPKECLQLPKEFPGMPPEIARQIQRDMARVQQDIRAFQAGVMPMPMPGFFLPFPKDFMPLMPEMPVPPVLPGANFNFSDELESSWSCVNGKFALAHRCNAVTYRVTGNMIEGMAVPGSIIVQQGDRSMTYTDMEQVPAEHRAILRPLLQDR